MKKSPDYWLAIFHGDLVRYEVHPTESHAKGSVADWLADRYAGAKELTTFYANLDTILDDVDNAIAYWNRYRPKYRIQIVAVSGVDQAGRCPGCGWSKTWQGKILTPCPFIKCQVRSRKVKL